MPTTNKTQQSKQKPTYEAIQDVLPQTQCELCDYPGCAPYAEAMLSGEAPIDRCASGGLPVLKALGELFDQDTATMEADLIERSKPPELAWIEPDGCIGCGKCIPVCPTDAIVGAAKTLHAVIESECTGCGLCLPTCPTDCIVTLPMPKRSDSSEKQRAQYWRSQHEETKQSRIMLAQKALEEKRAKKRMQTTREATLASRKAFIEKIKKEQEAIKNKKGEAQ
jgi:Na+-translocating ferredoxin:NAD+ oxidoreductase subunit B